MESNLHAAARRCLVTSEVDLKLERARALFEDWRAGRLARAPLPLEDVARPGRPPRPRLVPPAEVPRRRIGSPEGRAALIHAVAHIELNAVDLACDALWRFQSMPDGYYDDWTRVAAEEALHFSLLRERLRALGFDYGDFDAHDGLWELARQTADDPLRRMALVPRVMEARGLDVTPGMMERFAAIGDHRTVAVLEIILRDEVGHVEAGTRWFRHLCAERGLDPEDHYFSLLEAAFGGRMRCPLHHEARLRAGFTESELQRLEAMCKRS